MPPKAKKILITSETNERIVIKHHSREEILALCGVCGERTRIVSLDAAANILKVGTRGIIRLLDRGVLHEIETPEGILVVCGPSLEQFVEGQLVRDPKP